MSVEELPIYSDVIKDLRSKNRKKHLLFGNGFSIAYNPDIFSYNALSTFIRDIDDPLLKELFTRLNTKNFEIIMQQLDNFVEIADLFSDDKKLKSTLKNVSEHLRKSLIDAINSLHPEHVFTIPEEKSKLCSILLSDYLDNEGYVFPTNYDLLLYWVLMRNNAQNAIDGFGRDLETDLDEEYIPEENLEYSELRWGKHRQIQNVFYLHGALPLFDTGRYVVKEEYDNQHYLLENINTRIGNKEYPIFVTGGNANDKMNHIMHNKYLSFCYDKLCCIEGSLITFGFNFGEYDTHIIDAINIAAHQGKKAGNKLFSVYIGVYSEDDLNHINRIKKMFKCKVNIYNARTVNLWSN